VRTVKAAPFTSSSNLVDSVLKLLSESRTLFLLQDSSPVLNQRYAYFPWIRDQKDCF